jgi:transposase
MKGVDLYGRVRHAVCIEGISRREAARRFGIEPRTVEEMLAFAGRGPLLSSRSG